MDIKIDLSNTGIAKERIEAYRDAVDNVLERLWSDKEPYTGWVKLPLYHDRDELERILMTSDVIREQCETLIVIGIGGSYLGSKATISTLPKEANSPDVKFAGINLSAEYHTELLKEIREKEVCLCVISKSGSTIEITAAFNLFKKALIEKYGEEIAKKRIYTITDEKKGPLREETNKEGYASFVIPDNIGGRYSVLTPVGLLPAAVAGVDVGRILKGAEVMASTPRWDFGASDYAVIRYLLFQQGKSVEVFQHYEPKLKYFIEWIKQLFGESEGKDGKGLFPVGVELTAELHSLGQFLQDGNQIFFETILDIESSSTDLLIPDGPLQGKSMNQLNRAAIKGVTAAHSDAGIPVISICIPELSPFHYGQLIYFFETTCAITAKLMGVNPFDQPGVEAYKKEMKKEIS